MKLGFQIDHETMDLVRVRNILKLPFNAVYCRSFVDFIGNKAKGRVCAYQGVKNVCFWENVACFVSLKHPFC